jgi:hypothetical protein
MFKRGASLRAVRIKADPQAAAATAAARYGPFGYAH